MAKLAQIGVDKKPRWNALDAHLGQIGFFRAWMELCWGGIKTKLGEIGFG